ncbi:hypothetical protein SUGI_0150000 [Cryptomeria japonica]|nr:hypothetical protein SUGI_0150000 [Cryptomeria japonica]
MTRTTIKEWIAKSWGTSLVIKFIPGSFFVVVFADNTERDNILCKQNWFAGDHPVYIQPWAPNFNPLPLVVYDHPVWIRLYNLPIEYWRDQSLEKIGNSLGTLLEIDEEIVEKDLYTYARLKIVAVKEIPSVIILISSKGKWKHQVEIEKGIMVCNRCGSRFHAGFKCRMFVKRAWNIPLQKTKPKQQWAEKINPTKEVLYLPSIVGMWKDSVGSISGQNNNLRKEESEAQMKEASISIEQHSMEKKTKVFFEDWVSSSSSEGEFVRELEDFREQSDGLDNLDPRCLSQSTKCAFEESQGE